jgi:hypothetical protein
MANVPDTTRFIGFSNRVNLRERKSNVANAESQAYTMQDIADTTRPYKVFTALLSQSGGDNFVDVSGEGGTINMGVTYIINENPNNYDLVIYGAPNNNEGTYFVANQTSILNYSDSLQLTYNAGAPVATVLENTIGDVWFTFLGNGTYGINNTNEWDITKVWYGTSGIGDIGPINVNPGRTTMSFEGTSFIIVCYNNDYTSAINGQLINTPIEIRVYN